MESAGSKSNFSHGSINAQAAEKLFCIIKEKLANAQPLSKIPELGKLWHGALRSSCSITNNCSSDALLKLVASEDLKINEAFENIVNLCSSMQDLRWMVNFAMKLFDLQFVMNASKCAKSPFQMHSHTHPFIFMLNSAPQSWTCIVTEIQASFFKCKMLKHQYKNLSISNIISSLKPFFLYVLLNPSTESTANFYKTSLFNIFLPHLCVSDDEKDDHLSQDRSTLLDFVCNVLSCLNVTDVHLQLQTQLLSVMTSSISMLQNTKFISDFGISVLSSCYVLHNKPGCTTLACFLHQLFKSVSSVRKVLLFSLGLSNLICRSSPEALKFFLLCSIEMLKFPEWLSYDKTVRLSCLLAMKSAVLQLLLCKSFIGFNELSTLFKQALNAIENFYLLLCKDQKRAQQDQPFNQAHDSWIIDADIVLQSLLLCGKSNSVCSIKNALLVKPSENVALNVSLLINGVLMADVLLENSVIEKSLNCMEILSCIVSSFPQLCLTILPTILYVVKHEKNPEKQKHLLWSLPDFAVDNYSIPLVIGAIQAMCQVPALYSFAMKLMLKLWQKQKRCFPYLHKMLSQTRVLSYHIKTEITTMSCLALKELCNAKSLKNTSELLAMISSLLKKDIHLGQVVILMEALYSLLENEAVNIQSTWFELKEVLLSFTSDLVIKSIFKILSLVPKFEIENPNFMQFKADILTWLWQFIDHPSQEVKGALLVCLAHFNKEDFFVKHLPYSMQPLQSEHEITDEFLMQSIPGSSYFKLIKSLPCLTQTQYFCSSLLQQELQNMPRDIKDRALRAQKQLVRVNLFEKLYDFAFKMYERNKQPNLKSPFASSVLMCYAASDDQSIKSLVFAGRNVLQLLQALLGEVSIDAKHWKGLLWVVQGWKRFLQLCLHVMIKGRNAELNLQLQQKDCDKEDIQHKLATTDFWCRDKISDLLKTSSKGTPTMQGNSLLALAGLVCAIKFVASGTPQNENEKQFDSEDSGFLSHNHWVSMACDTLITAADSSYTIPGRIFSWCQYKSVSRSGRLTTSKFGEVCALHALRMLLPSLIPHDMDRITVISMMLIDRVNALSKVGNSCQDDNETPIISLHLKLSLGGVLSELHRAKIHETLNKKFRDKVVASVATLTSNALRCLRVSDEVDFEDEESQDEDTEDVVGWFIGSGEVVSMLFLSGSLKQKEDASGLFKAMLHYLDNLNEKSGSFLEAFYFSFVSICIAGRNAKVINDHTIADVLSKMKKNFSDSRNIPTSLALSHLCFFMKASGDKQASAIHSDLFEQFLKQTSNERLPTRQKLLSINGLVALMGSEAIFDGLTLNSFQGTESDVKKVVDLLKQFIQHGKDSGITGNSIALLGHLYLSLHVSSSRQSSTIPKSYSYLPESSVLKPAYNALISNSDQQQPHVFKVALRSISQVGCQSLKLFPPVDWVVPLGNAMSINLTEEDKMACLCLALSQSQENQTAATVLASFIEPSKFESFPLSCQCTLLKSLATVIQSLPSAAVLTFLAHIHAQFFNNNNQLSEAVLSGVLASLQLDNLPQDVPNRLFSFITKIISSYEFCLSNATLLNHWRIIAKCISKCPDYDFLSKVDSKDHVDQILFIRCQLVWQKLKPLQFLNNSVMECASKNDDVVQCDGLWMIFICISKLFSVQSAKKSELITWIQEIMTLLKKASTDVKMIEFYLKLLSVSMISAVNIDLQNDVTKGKSNLFTLI